MALAYGGPARIMGDTCLKRMTYLTSVQLEVLEEKQSSCFASSKWSDVGKERVRPPQHSRKPGVAKRPPAGFAEHARGRRKATFVIASPNWAILLKRKGQLARPINSRAFSVSAECKKRICQETNEGYFQDLKMTCCYLRLEGREKNFRYAHI